MSVELSHRVAQVTQTPYFLHLSFDDRKALLQDTVRASSLETMSDDTKKMLLEAESHLGEVMNIDDYYIRLQARESNEEKKVFLGVESLQSYALLKVMVKRGKK